tara:strand:- start:3232 stop:3606 length:375 start_codon:yes stop_codon:yes gene_type:complete
MALPSSSPADFPIGLDIVTIASVSYIADSIDLASQKTRLIERTDQNGDYAESQTRASGSATTGSLTLQRASSTTAFPPSGVSFTLDYDRSGTASTLETMDIQNSRSKDNADTFKVGIKLVTYQG